MAVAPAAATEAAAAQAPPPASSAAEPYDPLFDEEWDDEDFIGGDAFADPWENANRRTHDFNRDLDYWVLRPLTEAYAEKIPNRAKLSVLSFFENLGEPATFVNDLLQREWDDAAITFSRFLLNTTFGVAGLFDPAGAVFDIGGHNSDFGQTLALAGIPSGPYLVLPVMGPNNLRDSTGLIVDLFLRPTFWLLGPSDYLVYSTVQGTGHGIALREQHARSIDALEDSSIDFYSSLRNAYGQSREALIWHRRESHR
ncbi:MAG: VacJ family lipoprotein [Deltaproteobacteria bacterium]